MSFSLLLFLSVLQGVTELFPVSSLAHTLLVPALLGVRLDTHAPALLPFLVALHLGTALALLWFFRARWIALARGWFGSMRGRPSVEGHLAWGLIVGTVPAGLVGLLLEKPLERLFHDLRIVALALMVNGLVLWLGDRRQASAAPEQTVRPALEKAPERLTLRQAAWIGLAQIGALIPGFSRSGLTMVAGLRAGLDRAAAAEFSFLLGTPIILAAGVLELPKLRHDHAQLASAALGGLLTGLAAYLSVRFLMRYFEGRGRLASFGIYCLAAGAACLAWFAWMPPV